MQAIHASPSTMFSRGHPLAGSFGLTPESVFVRDHQLGAILSVSADTVWRWSRTGVIPKPHVIGPNATRWNLGEVMEHIRDQQEAA